MIEKKLPRIDWMTFSYQTDLSCVRDMRDHIEFLKDLFCFEDYTEITQKNQLVLNGQDIYICFRANLIYIQFRGSFFYSYHTYFKIIRNLLKIINKQFASYEPSLSPRKMILSRLDIAQDFVDSDVEYFLKEIKSSKKKICFTATEKIFSKNNVVESFYLQTSKYKVRIYRKDIEMRKEKNDLKRNYYEDNFGNNIVARFEIELSEARNLIDETFIFYKNDLSEQDLIEHALANFFQKHRIRIISEKDKKTSRWQDCNFWKSLFHPNENYSYTRKCDLKKSEYKQKNKKINFTKSLNNVVEFLDHKKNKEEAKETLLEYYKQAESEFKNRKESNDKKIKKTSNFFELLNDLNKAA